MKKKYFISFEYSSGHGYVHGTYRDSCILELDYKKIDKNYVREAIALDLRYNKATLIIKILSMNAL